MTKISDKTIAGKFLLIILIYCLVSSCGWENIVTGGNPLLQGTDPSWQSPVLPGAAAGSRSLLIGGAVLLCVGSVVLALCCRICSKKDAVLENPAGVSPAEHSEASHTGEAWTRAYKVRIRTEMMNDEAIEIGRYEGINFLDVYKENEEADCWKVHEKYRTELPKELNSYIMSNFGIIGKLLIYRPYVPKSNMPRDNAFYVYSK